MVAPDPFVSWLIAELHKYRDRCGLPTLDDIRACGVSRRQIRAYLRRAGWSCETPDTGDARTAQWANRAPEWHHDALGVVDLTEDDHAIATLAKAEQRSAWAVLDDCAYYAGSREIYHEDVLVAHVHGAVIAPAK